MVYPELEPARSGRVVMERALSLVEAYGRVDVPDIPLGKPSVSSPVISSYLAGLGADVIAHLRMQDHNMLSAKSIIKTLSYVGVRRILLLRGDPPRQGEPCSPYWQPEEAVGYARRYGLEAGLLLSPRRSLEDIEWRIRVGADVYYVTRASPSTAERISRIAGLVRRSGSALAFYIVVSTGRNSEYLEQNSIPSVPVGMLGEFLGWAERLGADRVILSSPGDGDALLGEVLEAVRRAGYR